MELINDNHLYAVRTKAMALLKLALQLDSETGYECLTIQSSLYYYKDYTPMSVSYCHWVCFLLIIYMVY